MLGEAAPLDDVPIQLDVEPEEERIFAETAKPGRPPPEPDPQDVADLEDLEDAADDLSPLSLIDTAKSDAENCATLLEADALFNASALNILSRKLVRMAQVTDDIDELRKVVQTVREGVLAPSKTKQSGESMAPLILVLERVEPKAGQIIDVRSGAKLAQLRKAAESAETVQELPDEV